MKLTLIFGLKIPKLTCSELVEPILWMIKMNVSYCFTMNYEQITMNDANKKCSSACGYILGLGSENMLLVFFFLSFLSPLSQQRHPFVDIFYSNVPSSQFYTFFTQFFNSPFMEGCPKRMYRVGTLLRIL